MVLADLAVDIGDFFVVLLWIAVFMVWAFAVFDIFRRDDLTGWARALWLVVVILAPLLGTFVYLIFRPVGATREERAAVDAANRQFVAQYEGTSTPNQLKILSDLHDSGKLTDDEFAAQKAKLLGS